MKIRYIVTLFVGVFLLACNGMNSNSTKIDAHLKIADRVDMGEFEGPLYKKFVTITFENTGSDTLIVMSGVSECECTEIEILTDRVAPHSKGYLRAYLDLSDYPSAPIEKRFFLSTNDDESRQHYITLVGKKK